MRSPCLETGGKVERRTLTNLPSLVGVRSIEMALTCH
jgi:hypothetical protein